MYEFMKVFQVTLEHSKGKIVSFFFCNREPSFLVMRQTQQLSLFFGFIIHKRTIEEDITYCWVQNKWSALRDSHLFYDSHYDFIFRTTRLWDIKHWVTSLWIRWTFCKKLHGGPMLEMLKVSQLSWFRLNLLQSEKIIWLYGNIVFDTILYLTSHISTFQYFSVNRSTWISSC